MTLGVGVKQWIARWSFFFGVGYEEGGVDVGAFDVVVIVVASDDGTETVVEKDEEGSRLSLGLFTGLVGVLDVNHQVIEVKWMFSRLPCELQNGLNQRKSPKLDDQISSFEPKPSSKCPLLIFQNRVETSTWAPHVNLSKISPSFSRRDDSSENNNNNNNSNSNPSEDQRRDRIILINPLTQGMIVIESSRNLETLFREFASKDGPKPASKSSIEAMEKVVIGEEEKDKECAICLDGWEIGDEAKAMPCKHKYHEKCIEKWLGIHGSCPVCRHKMPVDDEEEESGKSSEGGGEEEGVERGRRVEREIWVIGGFSARRDGGDGNGSSDHEN
ncbi:hypothetical protein IFM89_031331 [Coptis chinensis]|uniref:RING-type E3 ubiquitin transferase n=1 Tax=Coptis chinensis TaxID=261450 RepID=A0A835IZE8_9MAGN|nr:hypothetical protein IFM89_031331 [Coptis chinensis]